MRSLILLLLLSGCALFETGDDCTKTYTEYLQRPWCSKDVTLECKRKTVVMAVKPYENAFYDATVSYETAKSKDAITNEVASNYVKSKDSFCEAVNSIGDK